MSAYTSPEQVPRVSPRLTALEVLDVLRAAHRAPSIHNTQPWLFRPLPDGVEVLEDLGRALPASDPRGRDRLVSCGAAVRNAEIALARLGWRPQTVLFPAGPEDHLVARVVAGPAEPVTAEVEDLYRAIWERRTHRRIFMAGAEGTTSRSPCTGRWRESRGCGWSPCPRTAGRASPNCSGRPLSSRSRTRSGGRRSVGGRRRPPAGDGIPARSPGNAPFPVDSLLVRTLRQKDSAPAWITESLASGPVVVLLTDGDDRHGLGARTGLALESVLLAATAAGLVASFLNQVVQQESFRPALAAMLGEAGHPQAVLRIGQPLVDVPPTPRRP